MSRWVRIVKGYVKKYCLISLVFMVSRNDSTKKLNFLQIFVWEETFVLGEILYRLPSQA